MTASTANADYFWFLNTLVRVWTRFDAAADGLSTMGNWAALGDSPPLHIHHTEDELFYLLEGEFRFQIGSAVQRVRAGTALLAPKGAPHTYRVDSSSGGHWLIVTRRGDFEHFFFALARPAERAELPPPLPPPSAETMAELTKIAAAHQIELCGPPLA